MSRAPTSLFAAVALVALVVLLPWRGAAWGDGGCKHDGQQCATNMSCCSRNCVKPTVKHGAALFGLCCPSGARLVGGQCCVPNCTNKTCGDDGCGGSCGACDASQCLTCMNGTCGSECTSGEVCSGGSCITTTTTSTTSTTTTTILTHGCSYTCTDGVQVTIGCTNFANQDNCGSLDNAQCQDECNSGCASLGGGASCFGGVTCNLCP